MSWIEGIGDEVTIGVSIVLGLSILFIAWLSTGIREIPFISVIVVQLTRRRHVQADNGSLPPTVENTPSVNQPEENAEGIDRSYATSAETVAEAGSVSLRPENAELLSSKVNSSKGNTGSESDLSGKETKTGGQSQSTKKEKKETDSPSQLNDSDVDEFDDESDICPVTETELRQRRLEFFSSQNTSNTSSDNSSVTQSENQDSQKENHSGSGDNQSDNHSEIIGRNSDICNRVTQSSTGSKPNSLSELASNILSSTTQTESDSLNVNLNASEQNQQNENQSESGSVSQDTGLEPGLIRVRIKFLNDTQRQVTALATETIGNFRRKHFATELAQSKLVRFIFHGRDLQNDSSTLQSYNICDNSVLHCLVTQQPQQQQQDHHSDEDGFDIGVFMFPLFGLLLGIVWYMRFMYRQFFNVSSTLTLGGITFLYLAAFISSLRGNRNREHID